jgi:Ran-binding protein 1
MSDEPRKPDVEEASNDNPEVGGKEDEKAPEEESTATFEPVVKLDVVETKTGEEEEETLYSQRAKLFIFGETLLDKGTGKKTWRERGVGDIRLLKHREHQRIRVLMRQEKTMKILANHVLDPRITLETNAGSDRSWVWSAFDFSEGELVETVFAARFPDSDIANEFKKKFLGFQTEMEKILAGGDDAHGQNEADEAAAALKSLTTKDEEKAGTKQECE